MSISPKIDQLVEAFCCLPGIGRKTAHRMAFHLLQRGRESGRQLANSLQEAMDHVGHCHLCRTFSETPLCGICSHQQRDRTLVCVVESPADIIAFEQTASYRGLYFVTHGVLSPIDGIGPTELGLHQLSQRLSDAPLTEMIIAINSTPEGDATAHYLCKLLANHPVKLTRLAQGIPVGGNIEYIDPNTLVSALLARTQLSDV